MCSQRLLDSLTSPRPSWVAPPWVCRFASAVLRGGLRDGVDFIEIDNGRFSFSVLPSRGMGLWKARLDDIPVAWSSPVQGPVHPKFVPVAEPSGLGWLDGFDELLARCGILSNGAPRLQRAGTTHVSLARADRQPACDSTVELVVDDATGELTLVGVVDEVRFHCHKLRLTSTIRTKVGEPGLRITDEITNLSANPGEAQLLYHINFSGPFCVPGSKVIVPAKTVAPRRQRGADRQDMGHLWSCHPRHDRAGVLLRAARRTGWADADAVGRSKARGGRKPRLQYRAASLLHGLEEHAGRAGRLRDGPRTGDQLPQPAVVRRTTETGRPTRAGPDRAVRFCALEVHSDATSVERAAAEIKKLQGTTTPTLFEQPREGRSPEGKCE